MTVDDVPVLALQGISKRFGATLALDDVSFELQAGTVHALLGENGAGKTTLMRLAFGMMRPDVGSIRLHGESKDFRSPRDAIAAGIGMVHQHFTLVPAMTVAENIALGGHGRLDVRRTAEHVERLAELTGFRLDPLARVDSLPIAAQQRIEIAKALARQARILVLDEPTAVLAPPEVDELLRWLRTFVDQGRAAVVITHKLREAAAVADEVTVLRRGRRVFQGRARDTTEEVLTGAMLGADVRRPVSTIARRDERARSAVFEARELSVDPPSGDASGVNRATFRIDEGDIVGVAGIEGSGQRVLLRALAGRVPPTSGTLRRPVRVGFVPEDRHRDAILSQRTLIENVALRDAGRRRGLVSWTAMRARTLALMSAFDVRAPAADVRMGDLSGGNQQRLVVARELVRPEADGATEEAIVLENPTRGLDIRATTEVHERLRAASGRGAAIVVYSSDIDEVLALASRVLVVSAGTVHELPLDRDAVARAMLGLV